MGNTVMVIKTLVSTYSKKRKAKWIKNRLVFLIYMTIKIYWQSRKLMVIMHLHKIWPEREIEHTIPTL